MIVLPWEHTELRSFLSINRSLLEEDIKRILLQAKNNDSDGTEQEISANRVLEAVNGLKEEMGTLNLRLWGNDNARRG
jgi:hypothetical protein